MTDYSSQAISLLKQLIETPSLSREEDASAAILEKFFNENGVATHRMGNNVWAKNLHFDDSKPTILLNSHHDTVKPQCGAIPTIHLQPLKRTEYSMGSGVMMQVAA